MPSIRCPQGATNGYCVANCKPSTDISIEKGISKNILLYKSKALSSTQNEETMNATLEHVQNTGRLEK